MNSVPLRTAGNILGRLLLSSSPSPVHITVDGKYHLTLHDSSEDTPSHVSIQAPLPILHFILPAPIINSGQFFTMPYTLELPDRWTRKQHIRTVSRLYSYTINRTRLFMLRSDFQTAAYQYFRRMKTDELRVVNSYLANHEKYPTTEIRHMSPNVMLFWANKLGIPWP